MKIRTRRRLGVLAALGVVAALGVAPAQAAATATHSARPATAAVSPGFGHLSPAAGIVSPDTTTNSHWSGYDATTGTYTSVTATYKQPKVNCSSGGDVVFWVGLGGGTASSNSLQQNGTFAQCEGSTAVYSAWWETWPCNSITNYGGTVKPGDTITMKTINEGNNKYEFVTDDVTEGWSVSPSHTGCNGGSEATAEVITETPEIGSGLADLPDFGTVTYTGSTINNAALSAATPTKVNMARSGKTMDVTSAITGSGGTFTNTWKANS